MELFDLKTKHPAKSPAPLADRMRPKNVAEFVGQGHLVAKGRFLRNLIEKKEIPSIILWGPPGTGKTTLANIIAEATGSRFVSFSAVLSGVKEIRDVIKDAKDEFAYRKIKTILFVDEIHRFNKSQQDAFLHHVEDGTITLIGATTENPSFEVNAPLLSRCKVLVLKQLTVDDIKKIIHRAIDDKEKGLGNYNFKIESGAIDILAEYSHGDARCALNTIETAVMMSQPDKEGARHITKEIIQEAIQSALI